MDKYLGSIHCAGRDSCWINLGATSEALVVVRRTTASADEATWQRKGTAAFHQENQAAEPKLEHAHAHIGIPASLASNKSENKSESFAAEGRRGKSGA
jgi:hypothetical protein